METVKPGDGQDAGLRIVVLRHRGQPMPGAPGFDFGRRGGDIGRDPDCELPLADAERHVSRRQARIEHDGLSFVLLDCGSNPTRVDGRPLGRGERIVLHGGESLLIGAYELGVERLAAPALPAPGPGRAPADDPLGLFGAGLDPPRDLACLYAPHPESPGRMLPADDDPFAVFAPAAVASAGASPGQPLAEFLAGGPADGAGCLDPLVAFGMAGALARGDMPAPQRDDAPLLAQSFPAPRPLDGGCADVAAWSLVSRSVAMSSAGPASASPADAGIVELLQAFERGLGVPIVLDGDFTPERMERAGATLRAAVQAMLEQFQVRLCERLAQQQAENGCQAREEFRRLFDRELLRACEEQTRQGPPR